MQARVLVEGVCAAVAVAGGLWSAWNLWRTRGAAR